MVRLAADLRYVLSPGSFGRVVREMFAGGAMDFAVQLAYFLLLFSFPFILFLVNVAGLVVSDPTTIIEQLTTEVKSYLPSALTSFLKDYLSGALQSTTVPVFILSTLFTFAAGLSAVQHIIRAANRAYGVGETRPLWKRLGLSLLLVFGFVLFAATLMFIVLSPQMGDYFQQAFGLSGILLHIWSVFRWVMAFIGLTLAFGVLYEVGPNTELPFRLVSAGGLMTTVFLIIASKIFILWANNLFRPAELYGQLGGGIVILLWLFGIGLVLRFGIEINAQLARIDPEGKGAGTAEYSQKSGS